MQHDFPVTIGLTMDYEPPRPASAYNHGRAFYYVNRDYVRMVQGFGARVVCLPPHDDATQVEQLLRILDGLILIGGTDIDPAAYGEEVLDVRHGIDPERTAFEQQLVAAALDRDLPLLGVCRGAQMLNVALGGDLYQDLPSQRPSNVQHRSSTGQAARHAIRIARESRLFEILGHEQLEVNSYHHQGIRRLGQGVVAVAWSTDELVEAVEVPAASFCIGVQWHPERDSEREEERRLVSAFLGAALDYRRRTGRQ